MFVLPILAYCDWPVRRCRYSDRPNYVYMARLDGEAKVSIEKALGSFLLIPRIKRECFESPIMSHAFQLQSQ